MPGTLTDAAAAESSPRAAAPRRRRPRRPSSGHLLVLAAAVVAFVANWLALSSGTPTTTVLVAATDLSAGQRISAAQLVSTEIEGSGSVLEHLLSELPEHEVVLTTSVRAGDPLRDSDVTAPAGPDVRLRRMSLPVAQEQAVGGELRVGDRVDVLANLDDETSVIVSAVEVLAVSDPEDRGFGALGAFHITVQVDATQALCLASALDNGEIHVVLATGANPIPATCRAR